LDLQIAKGILEPTSQRQLFNHFVGHASDCGCCSIDAGFVASVGIGFGRSVPYTSLTCHGEIMLNGPGIPD
jgi:hypothetical protein